MTDDLAVENARLQAEVEQLKTALLAARDVLAQLQGELEALGHSGE